MSFIAPVTDTTHPTRNPGVIHIIVPRSRAYLADLIRKAFEGREDIEIIVDRRYSGRRTQTRSITAERRRWERRGFKEQMIEVVIAGISSPGGLGENPV